MKQSSLDLVHHNLRRLRLERGYTQKQLAEEIQKTVLTVSNWENGRSLPSISQLEMIAQALDVSIQDFFLSDDSRSLPQSEREIITFKIRRLLDELGDEDLSLVYRQIQALVTVRKGD